MANGQGLPLNLIVLGVIAALVLSIVIAFTIGGAGTTFGKIGKTAAAATGDELETVRSACKSVCDSSRFGLMSTNDWVSSAYCKKRTSIDLNGDGAIADVPATSTTPAQKELNLKCSDAPINVGCAAQVQTTTGVQSVTEAQCPA